MNKLFLIFAFALFSIVSADELRPLWDIPLNEGDLQQLGNNGTNPEARPVARRTDKLDWREGRLSGKALYFDNDLNGKKPVTALEIPAENSYDFTKPFSIMCWLKIDAKASTNAQYTFLGNVQSDYGPGFRLNYGWGTLRVHFGDGTSKNADSIAVSATKVRFKRGVWQHVAFTYDGKLGRIFLNGVPVAEKSIVSFPTKPVLRPFCIGSYNSYAYAFPGAISDIKLYDRALSPVEMLKLVKEL